MSCENCLTYKINVILPFFILIIFLYQIYAQYSTLISLRTKYDNERDGRNTMRNFHIILNKQFNFNLNVVQECFEDNVLMKIDYLKTSILNIFHFFFTKISNIFSKGEKEIDQRILMLYYLIIYDFSCIVIIYLFIYGNIKAGIIKILLQIFRFYFNSKRIKKFNQKMGLFSIIKSKLENMYLFRGWNIFNPEGFLIIEFLCNFAIILDILLLIIYIYRKREYKKLKGKKNISKPEGSESSGFFSEDNSIQKDSGKDIDNSNIINNKDKSDGNSDSDEKNSQNKSQQSIKNLEEKKSFTSGQIIEEEEEEEEEIEIERDKEENKKEKIEEKNEKEKVEEKEKEEEKDEEEEEEDDNEDNDISDEGETNNKIKS